MVTFLKKEESQFCSLRWKSPAPNGAEGTMIWVGDRAASQVPYLVLGVRQLQEKGSGQSLLQLTEGFLGFWHSLEPPWWFLGEGGGVTTVPKFHTRHQMMLGKPRKCVQAKARCGIAIPSKMAFEEELENPSYMFYVLFYCLAVDQNVVQVDRQQVPLLASQDASVPMRWWMPWSTLRLHGSGNLLQHLKGHGGVEDDNPWLWSCSGSTGTLGRPGVPDGEERTLSWLSRTPDTRVPKGPNSIHFPKIQNLTAKSATDLPGGTNLRIHTGLFLKEMFLFMKDNIKLMKWENLKKVRKGERGEQVDSGSIH